MTSNLIDTIDRIVNLLETGGWSKQASWYRDVQKRLDGAEERSDEIYACIEELSKSTTGMGGFSDLPLKSKSGTPSTQELRDRQWELADKLGQAIEEAKKIIKAGGN